MKMDHRPLLSLLAKIIPSIPIPNTETSEITLTCDCPFCKSKGSFCYTASQRHGESWRCSACKQSGNFIAFINAWNQRSPFYRIFKNTTTHREKQVDITEEIPPQWKESVAQWIRNVKEEKNPSKEKQLLLKKLGLSQEHLEISNNVFYNPGKTHITYQGKTITIPEGVTFIATNSKKEPVAMRVFTLTDTKRISIFTLPGSIPTLFTFNEDALNRRDLILIVDLFSEIKNLHLLEQISDKGRYLFATWWGIPSQEKRETWKNSRFPPTSTFLLSTLLQKFNLKTPPNESHELETLLKEMEENIFFAAVQRVLDQHNYHALLAPETRCITAIDKQKCLYNLPR